MSSAFLVLLATSGFFFCKLGERNPPLGRKNQYLLASVHVSPSTKRGVFFCVFFAKKILNFFFYSIFPSLPFFFFSKRSSSRYPFLLLFGGLVCIVLGVNDQSLAGVCVSGCLLAFLLFFCFLVLFPQRKQKKKNKEDES